MTTVRRIRTPQAFEVPVELDPSQTPRESQTVWIIQGPQPVWTGVTGWAAGIGVVALLLIAMTVGLRARGEAAAGAGGKTDSAIRIHAVEARCGIPDRAVRARVEVEVSRTGRVTRAVGSQNLGVLRQCVEAHARSWEFAPQATPVTLSLDMVLDPR